MAWESEPKTSEQDAVVGLAIVGKAVVGFSATVWDSEEAPLSTWKHPCSLYGQSGIAGQAVAGCMVAGGSPELGWNKEVSL